jgi:hypothetical protein
MSVAIGKDRSPMLTLTDPELPDNDIFVMFKTVLPSGNFIATSLTS